MAAPYPGNVTHLAQPAQDARLRRSSAPSALPDLYEALRLGWEDFKAVPSHAIILCVIYPCSAWCWRARCLAIRCCRFCFRWRRALPSLAPSRHSVFMNQPPS